MENVNYVRISWTDVANARLSEASPSVLIVNPHTFWILSLRNVHNVSQCLKGVFTALMRLSVYHVQMGILRIQ